MATEPKRRVQGRIIHECVKCPHLTTSHRLVAGAPLDGPYRCLHCKCEVQRLDPTRRISVADMHRLHAQELEFNEEASGAV